MTGSRSLELEEASIEELAAVVGMDLAEGEGQVAKDLAEGIAHGQPAATQESTTLTPDDGHMDHLEGMESVTRGVRPE